MSVLNIHLNPRISNYMVICKANSIFVAPRWLSALFLPITWTFRDKVVEFEHLHIFCERIWQGQCICSVKFHRYCQILKFDGSEFIIEEEDCKLQLINLLQFPIPVSNSSCVYNGKRVQVAYIWKSQDYKRTLCVCVCTLTRQKYVNFSRIYFSEKKNTFNRDFGVLFVWFFILKTVDKNLTYIEIVFMTTHL